MISEVSNGQTHNKIKVTREQQLLKLMFIFKGLLIFEIIDVSV